MSKVVIIHYHEIALKGKNKAFFEKRFKENIEKALKGVKFAYIYKFGQRFVLELTEDNFAEIKVRLQRVFGIAFFSLAEVVEIKNVIGRGSRSAAPTVTKIKNRVFSMIKNRKFKTFAVKTRRSEKDFPLNSVEINEKIGEFLRKKLNKKVDLTNPDLTCHIDIVRDRAFLYCDKIKGPGGLPVSTSGKVAVLLSGGIDSPAAAYLMMKRGARCIFVHFHSYPHTDQASIDKTKDLVEVLSQYQYGAKVYLVSFLAIQKEIMMKCEPKFRVILYRRMMVRIAQIIAYREKCLALVTGESLGQVASQTLDNLQVVDDVSNLLILRPLIGFDKDEIVKLASKIGTYEVSIKPHADCCSLFMPKKPILYAKVGEVEREEKKLDVEMVIEEAISKTEKISVCL